MALSRSKRLDRRRRERETAARLQREYAGKVTSGQIRTYDPRAITVIFGGSEIRGFEIERIVTDDQPFYYLHPERSGTLHVILNQSVEAGQMITDSMIAHRYGPLHLDPVSAVQAAIADGVLPYCGVGWFHDTSEYVDILLRKTLTELHDLWFFVERERLRVDEFDHTGNGTKKRLRGIVRALARWSDRIASEIRCRSSEPDRLVGGCIGE